MFRAPKLIQLLILQIFTILPINSARVVTLDTLKSWSIDDMSSTTPREQQQKSTTSPCICAKDEIDLSCLDSLKHDADIAHVYRGEKWISTGWKNERTPWAEPHLCPDLTLVTEYGFNTTDEFFIICTPAENIIDPENTNSCRKAVTIQIPTRSINHKFTIEMRHQLNRGRSRIVDRNGTYSVAPYADGFTPQLLIYGDVDVLLDTFDLTSPRGPNSKQYRYDDRHLNPWALCPWANSSWTPPHQCPKGQAICGVTTSQYAGWAAQLATFAFKCCPVCYPRENWGHIHTVINRSSKPYQHVDLDRFGTAEWLGSAYHDDHKLNYDDYDYDRQSSYMARFAPIFGPKAAQGFNWGWNGNGSDLDLDLDLNQVEGNNSGRNVFDPCPAWSTCRYRQLLGLCGNKVVVITDHFDMDAGPLTFRDLFHCLVLGWESFFHHKNTCVAS